CALACLAQWERANKKPRLLPHGHRRRVAPLFYLVDSMTISTAWALRAKRPMSEARISRLACKKDSCNAALKSDRLRHAGRNCCVDEARLPDRDLCDRVRDRVTEAYARQVGGRSLDRRIGHV